MPLVINTLGADTHTDAQTHTHTDVRTKRFQETRCVQPCVPGLKIVVKIFVLEGYRQKYLTPKIFVVRVIFELFISIGTLITSCRLPVLDNVQH